LARENADRTFEYLGGAKMTLAGAKRERFWKAVAMLQVSYPALSIAYHGHVTWLRPEIRVRVRALRGEKRLRNATILDLARLPPLVD